MNARELTDQIAAKLAEAMKPVINAVLSAAAMRSPGAWPF